MKYSKNSLVKSTLISNYSSLFLTYIDIHINMLFYILAEDIQLSFSLLNVQLRGDYFIIRRISSGQKMGFPSCCFIKVRAEIQGRRQDFEWGGR